MTVLDEADRAALRVLVVGVGQLLLVLAGLTVLILWGVAMAIVVRLLLT